MNHPTSTLSEVVREALDSAGYLTPKGYLTRDAERRTGLSRATVARALAADDLTSRQLRTIATLLGLKPSQLQIRAEERAA